MENEIEYSIGDFIRRNDGKLFSSGKMEEKVTLVQNDSYTGTTRLYILGGTQWIYSKHVYPAPTKAPEEPAFGAVYTRFGYKDEYTVLYTTPRSVFLSTGAYDLSVSLSEFYKDFTLKPKVETFYQLVYMTDTGDIGYSKTKFPKTEIASRVYSGRSFGPLVGLNKIEITNGEITSFEFTKLEQ